MSFPARTGVKRPLGGDGPAVARHVPPVRSSFVDLMLELRARGVLSALQVQQIAGAAAADLDSGCFDRVREVASIGASGAQPGHCFQSQIFYNNVIQKNKVC